MYEVSVSSQWNFNITIRTHKVYQMIDLASLDIDCFSVDSPSTKHWAGVESLFCVMI